jgi:hypothetical protein
MRFPVAEEFAQTSIWVSHPLFLGGTDLMDQFVEAVEKVRANAAALKDYTPQAGMQNAPAHLRT